MLKNSGYKLKRNKTKLYMHYSSHETSLRKDIFVPNQDNLTFEATVFFKSNILGGRF